MSPPVEVGRGYRVPRAASTHLAALRDALHTGPATDVLAQFWDETAAHGTPLLEELTGGEWAVTFLWRDDSPEASPHVLANKLHDRTDPAGSRMEQIDGTDVWHLTYRLPGDWRGSYVISVGPPTASGRADPLCKERIGAGADVRSLVELPDARAQPYRRPRPSVPAGRLTDTSVDAPGGARRVWVYEPAGPMAAMDGGLAAVVMLDGALWAEELDLATTLDNLVAVGAVPPLVAALVDTGSGEERARLLATDPSLSGWLAGELLDHLAADHPITGDPRATVVAGQSFGGLAALRTAGAHPDRFGAVLAQSASLWSPAAAEVVVRPGTRVWMEVGSDEWINTDPNERFATAFAAEGGEVQFRVYRGGHDRACWAGGVADGLIALLGR